MKKFIFLLVILCTRISIYGQVVSTNTTGSDWSLNSTWVGNNVPVPTDDVIIKGGVFIAAPFAQIKECNNLLIDTAGLLIIAETQKLIVHGNMTNTNEFSGHGGCGFSFLEIKGDLLNHAKMGFNSSGTVIYGNVLNTDTVHRLAVIGCSGTADGVTAVQIEGNVSNQGLWEARITRVKGNIINTGNWNAFETKLNGDSPQLVSGLLSGKVQLESDVVGSPFQWYKNNQILTGETTDILTLDSLGVQENGIYYCHTSNGISRPIILNSAGSGSGGGGCLPHVTIITDSICIGDSIVFGSNTYTQEGIYVDSLTNSNNCDSLVLLDLTVFDCSVVTAHFGLSGNCVGNGIQFTDSSAAYYGIDSLRWDFGDGETSTEVNPVHIFNAPNDYDVQLIACSDSVCDTVVYTISVKEKLKLSIVEHASFPNEDTYDVMASSTIHHYFLLKDEFDQVLGGTTVMYKIIQNGDTAEYESLSEPNGLLDLNIQLGGSDPTTIADDWINPGIATIEFSKVIPHPDSNYCSNSWDELQNDFSPISIHVREFDADKKIYGFFGKAGVDLEACTVCLGIGSLGVSGLSIGVGGQTGLYYSVENRFDDLGGVEGFELDIERKSSIDFNAEIGTLKLKLPISVKGNSQLVFGSADVSIKNKINEKIFIKIDSNNDLLYGLYNLVDVVSQSSLFYSVQYDLLKSAIGHFIQDELENRNLESGLSLGLELNISLGPELKFNLFDDLLGVNLKFANFDSNTGFEIGGKYLAYKGTQATSHFFRQYSSWDFTGLGGNMKLFGGTLISESFYPLMNKGIQYTSFRDEQTNNMLSSEVSLYNTTQVSVQGDATNMETVGTVTVNSSAMNFLNNQAQSFDNSVANFLLGIDDLSPLQTEGTPAMSEVNDYLDYLRFNYQPGWDNREITYDVRRTFHSSFSGELELNAQLALGKIGGKFNPSVGAGLFFQREYPYQQYVYFNELDTFLLTVAYPNNQAFIQLPADPFSVFWNEIQAAFVNAASDIYNGFKNLLTSAGQKIENGFVWLTNETRSFLGLNRRSIIPPDQQNSYTEETDDFEDFSVISIGYPQDGSVFSSNADISLDYYYPEGKVRGLTQAMDTIIIVSDVFYFQAIVNGDTVDSTPNGQFVISSQLGAEDLEFLGLTPESSVELYHSTYGDSVWTSIAPADTTISFDKLGMFALGTVLVTDTIPPTIDIISPNPIDEHSILSATITDDKTGINWSSVEVFLGGIRMPFERIGFTNEITIPLDSFPEQFQGPTLLSVQATDNSENHGFDLATIDISTSLDGSQTYHHLLRLYPNPATDVVNVIYQAKQAGEMNMKMFNMVGNLVHEENESLPIPGVYSKHIDLTGFSKGTYFILFSLNGLNLESRRIVIR